MRPAPAGRLALGALIVAALSGAGCADDNPQSTPAPSFGADPDQTLVSDSGALRIAVRYSPQPPAVGLAAAQLSFTDLNGSAATGLALAVVPWMPAHGHGTSVDPTVTETTPGTFVADPLVLFMPGSWELRLTTSGSVDDTAKAVFEIP